MLGMSLDAGGHLTHGFRPNISGKMFRPAQYGVDPRPVCSTTTTCAAAHEEKPLVLVAGYSAYPRKRQLRVMREIADEVGATLMVDMAHFAGLVAGKVLHRRLRPRAHAHIVTTTTHKSLRGPRGGMVLCQKELADTVDRGCPLVLGGPLPHVMAAKAVASPRRCGRSSPPTPSASSTTPQALAETLIERAPPSSPAAPTTTSCSSTSAQLRPDRPPGRERPARRPA
jgi:glycine hydroxymethyltransferase